ncbi:MAG: hypothetical protein J1F11_05815 [Oscillospiraceae bacterium]|nr:hypothetical protein [Oscillospiraceae bacterium]
MRKKLLVSIICAAALLSGCGNTGAAEIFDIVEAEITEDTTTVETTIQENESETKDTETESVSSTETEETVEDLPAEIKVLNRDELGVNADGSLSEAFRQRIEELMLLYPAEYGIVYPSLYDFDDDGIPEIFLIYHNSGQGYMPCKVYSAADLSYLGEFEGFCRDGFTHLRNAYGGTMIHSYYEHSVHQRQEDYVFAKLVNGKLETTWIYGKNGGIRAGEFNPTVYSEVNMDEEALERITGLGGYVWKDRGRSLVSYNDGCAFTSYDPVAEPDEPASAAIQSYNNYIRLSHLADELLYTEFDQILFMGDKNETVFLKNRDGLFFIDEDGEKTFLSDEHYETIYKIWDSLVVCQPIGNTAPCDVYRIRNGKPEFIEELSGKGMYLDYSGLYNDGLEMIHSVYDASSWGAHTFKKYQFYDDLDGFHEYGSIVVPLEEFYAAYGDEAVKVENQIAELNRKWYEEYFGDPFKKVDAEVKVVDYEIYEVLYRSDYCFILNCRQPVYLDAEQQEFAGGYHFMYAIVKPMIDGTLSDVIEWDHGWYMTALCPDIAVYPEKMYLPGEY